MGIKYYTFLEFWYKVYLVSPNFGFYMNFKLFFGIMDVSFGVYCFFYMPKDHGAGGRGTWAPIILPHLPLKSPYKNWQNEHKWVFFITHFTQNKLTTMFLRLSILTKIINVKIHKLPNRGIPPPTISTPNPLNLILFKHTKNESRTSLLK